MKFLTIAVGSIAMWMGVVYGMEKIKTDEHLLAGLGFSIALAGAMHVTFAFFESGEGRR